MAARKKQSKKATSNCQGLTASGEPCRNHAMESGYCAGHDPMRQEFRTRRRCLKLMGLDVPTELQREAGLTPERMEIATERQGCVMDERMDAISRRLEQAKEIFDAGGSLRYDFSGLLPSSGGRSTSQKKPAKRKKWKWRRP